MATEELAAPQLPALDLDAKRDEGRRRTIDGRSLLVTSFAIILLAFFLSPLLRTLTLSLKSADQITTIGAPIWPANPGSFEWEGEEYSSPRHHSVSLMCDDLEETVEQLRGRGAEFNGDPQDMGFGTGIMLRVPGADDMLLYQPKHPTAYDL